jgi:hypothetical protein
MTIYVGPYVRVPAVTRDEPVSQLVCSANCGGNARLSASTRFCPDCGAAVEKRITTKQVTRVLCANYAADDIGREYIDLMTSANESSRTDYAAWIPNRHGYGQHFENRDSVDVPFADDATREAETAKFLTRHGQFIAAVEAHFGVVPTVHYGVVVIHY